MPVQYTECEIAKTQAEIDSLNISNEEICCSIIDDMPVALLETQKRDYSLEDNINISYLITNNVNIRSFSINSSGFLVNDAFIDSGNQCRLIIDFEYLCVVENYSIDIDLCLENGLSISIKLFALANEDGVFISPSSKDDAYQKYIDYLLLHKLITYEEYVLKQEAYSRIGVIETFDTSNFAVSANSSARMTIYSNETETAVYQGYLRWLDGDGNDGENGYGNIHPLRRVSVEIYCQDDEGEYYLDSDITDDEGFFYFVVPANIDVFLRIYPGDDNICIKIGNSNNNYYYRSGVYQDIVPNSVVTYSSSFTMANDLGRAFQISQAALTARDYAETMSGERPSNVIIRYPFEHDTCCYNPNIDEIRIIPTPPDDSYFETYESWDVIMHEYGHHIQYEYDIYSNPGYEDHNSLQIHSDVQNSVEKGTKIAWGEAWPTVFALMAQEYYSSVLVGIGTNGHVVGNAAYEAYNLDYSEDIEHAFFIRGDSCENSIMAVLWDIYDDENDNGSNVEDYNAFGVSSKDEITLGHQNWWNITVIPGTHRFSQFVNNFYETYPQYIDELAQNLTLYNMATSAPTITNSSQVSLTVSPVLYWQIMGGSQNFPLNSFDIIVVDEEYDEILRIEGLHDLSCLVDSLQWNQSLKNHGYVCGESLDVFISILGYRVDEDVTTGPYYSEFIPLIVNCDHTYEYKSVNASYHKLECSCGATTGGNLGHVWTSSNIIGYAECKMCKYLKSSTGGNIPIIKEKPPVIEEVTE